MSNMLELNCLILREDIDKNNIFTIQIADDKAVDNLKDAIREEQKPTLDYIGASILNIYKTSFFIDDDILEEEVRKFRQNVIDVQGPLRPISKLSKSFSNLSDEYLHVIVKVPHEIPRQSPTSDSLLRMWCYILGDDFDQIFPVKIASTENVGDLKDVIKEKNQVTFRNVDSKTLELFSVSIPDDQIGSVEKNSLQPRLSARRILSEVFPTPLASNHIHVIVNSPSADFRVAKEFNPSGFKWGKYRRDYWKTPLETSLTVLPNDLVMDESGDDVLPGEPFAECFLLGRIFIRVDYLRMFDYVEDLHQKEPGYVAIVTGQSGIGKTYWIYYAMRRRLGEGKPVFLYQNDKFVYFSHTCVEVVDPEYIECEDYTWCFVDSVHAPQHLPTIISTSRKLFPIYVTSPNEHHWVSLEQIRMMRVFLMNPWTWAEIEKAASLENYRKFTRDEIFERFINTGPTARICLSYDADQLRRWYNERDIAIEYTATDKLLQDLAITSNLVPVRTICLVRRTNVERVYRVEPISQTIIGLLRIKLKRENRENREKLIQSFFDIPQVAGMIGNLFEIQLHDRFTTRIELEAHPMPMHRYQTKNSGPMKRSAWHSPFEFTPEYHSRSPHKITISPKERVRYGNTKIDIEQDVYYTPTSYNRGTIDSLIVHSGCLYVFQFSVSSNHTFNDQIKTLDRFNGLPSKEHRYFVFVFPKSVNNFRCPHSEGDFLGGNTPYIAHIDLYDIVMDESNEV